jgi:transcriptional regulator with XRE-family HTH domain
MTRCFDISDRLRAIMQTRGLTTTQLGLMAGIPRKMIWWWFKSPGHKASIKNIRKVAAALRIPITAIAPTYTGDGMEDSFYSGAPCGMKRALEIIGEDYLDSPAPAVHFYQPHVPYISHTGKYVQQ